MNQYGRKTGSYRWDGEKFVKVKDHPRSTLPDAYVPEGGYIDEHLGEFVEGPEGIGGTWRPASIRTKEQKAALMREKGIVEDGGWTKRKKVVYFT